MPGKYIRLLKQIALDRILDAKTAGVLLNAHVVQTDGGPGSGNWGHKGRPGKVGGSGKGGGRQYRGGRSDIKYVGSRGDWLNGLSGQRQHEAEKFVARMRDGRDMKLKLKDEVESLLRSGGMKADEAEKLIKERGLDKVRQDMTPEEYVMRCCPPAVKRNLLDYMAEARGWDEHAGKLIDENLSDDEKRLVEALGNKYGMAFIGNVGIPDDSSMTDQWDPEDLAFWQDMKSKAMDGPTSGKEPPEELMYEAGLKERPKRAINIEWATGRELAAEIRLRTISRTQRGTYEEVMDLWKHPGEVEELEKKAFKETENYDFRRYYELMRYMEDKIEHSKLGDELSTLWRRPSDELQKNLTEDEYKKLEELSKEAADKWTTLPKYIRNQMRYPEAVEAFALMNKALGGADCIDIAREATKAYREKAKQEEEEKKRLEEERKKRLEEAERQIEEHHQASLKVFEAGKTERAKKYASAKDSNDVARIMSEGGIFAKDAEADMTGVDVECARAVADSYERVVSRFPFLAGTLGKLTPNEKRYNVYACCYSYLGGGIDLNASQMFFGNIEKIKRNYEGNVASNYHPKGTDYTSVVTHELGHALDGYLTRKGILGGEIRTKTSGFSGKLRLKVLKKLGLHLRDVGSGCSQYATENAMEWFAECFAEAMHSDNPRPMAKEMMRQLEQIIQEEGL